jgi:hypothetical protein
MASGLHIAARSLRNHLAVMWSACSPHPQD